MPGGTCQTSDLEMARGWIIQGRAVIGVAGVEGVRRGGAQMNQADTKEKWDRFRA